MKKLSVLFALSVIVLLFASMVFSCATPKAGEEVVLRLTLPQPPGDPNTVKIEEMAQRFNERTGGAYTITVHPGAQLVGLPETLDAVRTGTVEMASVTWPVFSGIEIRLSELPFLFRNSKAAGIASQDPRFLKSYNEIFESKYNQHALSVYNGGMVNLACKKPVKTMDDWKGLLVATGSGVAGVIVEDLGGASVTMPWTDYYSSLEKGVVDGALAGGMHVNAIKLYDVAPNFIILNAFSGFQGTTINMDVWNAMPKRTQDILVDEIQKFTTDINNFIVDFDDVQSLTIFPSLGVDVYVVPDVERDKWVEALRPYLEEQLSSWGEHGKMLREVADKANTESR